MNARQFLICDSKEHAELVDGLIFAMLVETENVKGSRWSGVHTDGTQFGILWGDPVSSLFGEFPNTEGLTVTQETPEFPWTEVIPEPEPTES